MRTTFIFACFCVLSGCASSQDKVAAIAAVPASFDGTHIRYLIKNSSTSAVSDVNWFKHISGKPFGSPGRFNAVKTHETGLVQAFVIVSGYRVSCIVNEDTATRYRVIKTLAPVRISGALQSANANGVGLADNCLITVLKSGEDAPLTTLIKS